jgi:hypothetical protein
MEEARMQEVSMKNENKKTNIRNNSGIFVAVVYLMYTCML